MPQIAFTTKKTLFSSIRPTFFWEHRGMAGLIWPDHEVPAYRNVPRNITIWPIQRSADDTHKRKSNLRSPRLLNVGHYIFSLATRYKKFRVTNKRRKDDISMNSFSFGLRRSHASIIIQILLKIFFSLKKKGVGSIVFLIQD